MSDLISVTRPLEGLRLVINLQPRANIFPIAALRFMLVMAQLCYPIASLLLAASVTPLSLPPTTLRACNKTSHLHTLTPITLTPPSHRSPSHHPHCRVVYGTGLQTQLQPDKPSHWELGASSFIQERYSSYLYVARIDTLHLFNDYTIHLNLLCMHIIRTLWLIRALCSKHLNNVLAGLVLNFKQIIFA